MRQHHYHTTVEWTGNEGTGTSAYAAYGRNHMIQAAGKPVIPGSSDPSFRGDKTRYNPEELLVASLSSCHMLWYLHLCAVGGIIVTSYIDHAEGVMTETAEGSGQFKQVILKPVVTITDPALAESARALHEEAHKYCFIARSCNFPVTHEPELRIEAQ
ncbi:OsmC family protein [Chitinophaga flava]|uniref:Peroxiredoxin n=1 Tax=Chitinophaga flava TaxID=2259036 RepID=A0A365XY67_9BACT|nr:OsmC family protein [Chitinophaga flava]RBL91008.1 peroxiredoxin [Chitinophaga flava]